MPRLQFSIRAILLLMAIVGVAIVIYRWPWTETIRVGADNVTTQYRRGWNGRPVKHGLQRMTVEQTPAAQSAVMVYENWYEDDELRRSRDLQGDVVYIDQSFRNGQLDGPYLDLGPSKTRGSYRAGKKHGNWEYSSVQLVEEEVWQNGERHGPRTWKTPQGRLLQTAAYANNRLTQWNGRPFAAEFRRWVTASIPDTDLQAKLLMEMVIVPDPKNDLHYQEVVFYVGDPPQSLVLQGFDTFKFGPTPLPFHGRPIGEAILEEVLDHSHLLTYRYGLLHVVPISAKELDWQDRTGVTEIRFPPGSAAEQHWLSPVDQQWQLPGQPD